MIIISFLFLLCRLYLLMVLPKEKVKGDGSEPLRRVTALSSSSCPPPPSWTLWSPGQLSASFPRHRRYKTYKIKAGNRGLAFT